MSKLSADYNLRSSKADQLQFLVQLQLSDNPEFLSKLVSSRQQSKFCPEKEFNTDTLGLNLNCGDKFREQDIK